MLSLRCNSCIKSYRIWKKIRKNFKIKPFIGEYNWIGINYQFGEDDWEKIRKII